MQVEVHGTPSAERHLPTLAGEQPCPALLDKDTEGPAPRGKVALRVLAPPQRSYEIPLKLP